jgi:glucose/mannose-6-phosphate isomerase
MKGCGVAEVWTQGESRLAKLLTTMHFGDWVSIYLAAMYGVDPSSIDNIKLLKAKLAEAGPVKF